ncbi:glycerophosphodiester phosphodiesterase [Sutcliffiella halmapala]|uniref:glycerophosphodiester phosphodiesterase n=1 Tax=Sutcliffiella halmapala TaxID=79882 RepID=UPI000995D313|nr:glycerophosphodiester phosphodiesterase [Sutcliffiella halmapala]
MTKIFGHRGSAGTHPENTMISFKQAVIDGADGIELDVQLSKDGIPVVIHDEKVDRTTNGKGFVQDMTLKELQNLNAVYKFANKYKTATIPTLEEVLSWASNNNIYINIELKNGIIAYEGLEEKVVALVTKFKLQSRIIFSSFNHYSIAKLHVLVPEIEKAVLYMEGIYKPWEYTKWVGAQSIHPNIKACPAELIEQSQVEGVPVRPFTVNDQKVMQKLFTIKCAGFFTDYPKIAVQLKN